MSGSATRWCEAASWCWGLQDDGGHLLHVAAVAVGGLFVVERIWEEKEEKELCSEVILENMLSKFFGIRQHRDAMRSYNDKWLLRHSACLANSVTRWLDYFSIFGHWQRWKLPQECHKFAKVGAAFYQIRNKPSKFCQRFLYFCQSGKISPNLITLLANLMNARTTFDDKLWLSGILRYKSVPAILGRHPNESYNKFLSQ